MLFYNQFDFRIKQIKEIVVPKCLKICRNWYFVCVQHCFKTAIQETKTNKNFVGNSSKQFRQFPNNSYVKLLSEKILHRNKSPCFNWFLINLVKCTKLCDFLYFSISIHTKVCKYADLLIYLDFIYNLLIL